MWIMSQHGFYSIVQLNQKPDTFLVRARHRQDLESLTKLAGLAAEIKHTPSHDYPYRIVVNGAEVQTIMARLGETIDYPNFKARIHELPEQENKNAAYMQIWSTMRGTQRTH